MGTYEKLEKQKAGLKKAAKELKEFTQDPGFKQLTEVEQELVKAQLSTMQTLFRIISARMEVGPF